LIFFSRRAEKFPERIFFAIFACEINLHAKQNYSCNCAGILRQLEMAKKKPAKKKAVKAGKKKK